MLTPVLFEPRHTRVVEFDTQFSIVQSRVLRERFKIPCYIYLQICGINGQRSVVKKSVYIAAQ